MKELIKISKEVGFKSEALRNISVISTSELFVFLWMCELQKWLRDEKNIDVEITSSSYHGSKAYTYNVYTGDFKWNTPPTQPYRDTSRDNSVFGNHESHEKALQYGLLEACKLIK